MENSPIRGIPYPSEYDNPFTTQFEDFIAFLDQTVEYRYTPVSGFVSTGPDTVEFTGSLALDQAGAKGRPLRHRDNDYEPWQYCIIREWNSIMSPAIVYVDGAPFAGPDSQVEIGGSSQVKQKHLFSAGVFNDTVRTGFFYEKHGNAFRWDGPPARMVRCVVHCKTEDSTVNPVVMPIVNKAYNAMSSPYWIPMSTAGSGAGIECDAGFNSTGATSDVQAYRVESGDVIDVIVDPNGGTGDAADFSVELTFVLDGHQDQKCLQGYPPVVLTIVDMEPGEDWQGLTNGVHTLCPNSYGRFRTVSAYYTTSIYTTDAESWLYGSGSSYLAFRAVMMVAPASTFSNSYIRMKYLVGGTLQLSYSLTYSASVYGWIRDRLFTSFNLGAATFTLQRGVGNWAEP